VLAVPGERAAGAEEQQQQPQQQRLDSCGDKTTELEQGTFEFMFR